MTTKEKEQIRSLRLSGKTYTFIAVKLGMKENAIKVFCNRNGLTDKALSESRFCRHCGNIITEEQHTKPRMFCTDDCRREWWKAHPECVTRKAIYNFVCARCGKAFTAYGNKNRKFCSHACYVQQRYGKEGEANE